MNLAKKAHEEYKNAVKTPTCKYAKFWCDLMVECGFNMDNTNGAPDYGYHSFLNWRGQSFMVFINPAAFKGAYISGTDNNGDNFRKKVISEIGLKKFLEKMQLGIFYC
jgi:hypothetical protein